MTSDSELMIKKSHNVTWSRSAYFRTQWYLRQRERQHRPPSLKNNLTQYGPYIPSNWSHRACRDSYAGENLVLINGCDGLLLDDIALETCMFFALENSHFVTYRLEDPKNT